MSAIVKPDLLQQTFLVYSCFDHDSDNEQEHDQVVVFFHPATNHPHIPLWVHGIFESMRNFTRNFTEQPLQIVIMTRAKMAMKQVGDIVMVLGGDATDSDHVVTERLNFLYDVFRMFSGGFERVWAQFPARKEFNAKISGFFELMKPMITSFHRPAMKFCCNALLYTDTHPSIFIKASQVLTLLEYDDRHHLAGALFCDSSVMCSNIDADTCRKIFSFVQCKRNAAATFECLDVFVPRNTIKRLRSRRGIIAGGSDNNDDDDENIKLHVHIFSRLTLVILVDDFEECLHRQMGGGSALAALRDALRDVLRDLERFAKHKRTTTQNNFFYYNKPLRCLRGDVALSTQMFSRLAHEDFALHPKTAVEIFASSQKSFFLARNIFAREIYFTQTRPISIAADWLTTFEQDCKREYERNGIQYL